MKKMLPFVGFLILALLSPRLGGAEEGPLDRREPLSLEQMEEYKDIPFTVEGFERIGDGMSERDVLSTVGKPENVRKEHRRHNRWTVHYFYPGGYVVNFRNGLVVGKEKN